MFFNETTDNIEIEESGFINKDKLLEYVSEEDIFQLVFGFKPREFEYVTSPFREDTNPGCWFETDVNTNKLRFVDFGNPEVIKGIKMSNIDCFDAVQVYFNLPNFYKTLDFIKDKFLDSKSIKHNIPHRKYIKSRVPTKSKVKLLVSTRDFYLQDRNFWWKRYRISKENLIEDKVFPIKKFKMLNTKKGNFTFRTNDIAYVYTEFKSGNKKIYRPFAKGTKRFITTCNKNDVGGMNTSIKAGKLLVITKSYKDYRVLKNLGLNVRWLQNEGMFPENQEFWKLISNFRQIIVFFDNDNTGILAAKKLVKLINTKEGRSKARLLHLPIPLLKIGIKDPSDFVYKKDINELTNFLKMRKIL